MHSASAVFRRFQRCRSNASLMISDSVLIAARRTLSRREALAGDSRLGRVASIISLAGTSALSGNLLAISKSCSAAWIEGGFDVSLHNLRKFVAQCHRFQRGLNFSLPTTPFGFRRALAGLCKMETAAAITDDRASRPALTDPLFWLKVAVTVGLVAALYSFILPDLASEWWTVEASSYGMLVPPIALYLAWMNRRTTLALPAQSDGRGLLLVAAACFTFLVGQLAAEFFLARISFVLLLAGFTWTLWGLPRLRTLAFPLVLLATMVPLPTLIFNAVAAPLQLFASSVATQISQMLGVSIFRDGNIIHLATTSLGVEEACSGLNSLSSMVVGALLLGHLEDASLTGRILLTVLSVPLAIAVNVVRVAGTAVLADYQPDYAVGFYHLFSGWVVFVLGFGLLWLLGKLMFRLTRKNS
jgi:exosortase